MGVTIQKPGNDNFSLMVLTFDLDSVSIAYIGLVLDLGQSLTLCKLLRPWHMRHMPVKPGELIQTDGTNPTTSTADVGVKSRRVKHDGDGHHLSLIS